MPHEMKGDNFLKITFYSNYLTHHQIPFSNEMYRILGDDYKFVSTEPMTKERINMGWDSSSTHEFEIRSYESQESHDKALQLAKESDVVIHGSAPEFYIQERLKDNDKLTFRYSERIYKNGRWRVFSPRGLYMRFKTYFKFFNKPLYMLSASAFTASDFALLYSYIGRCYKWGYFPSFITYNTNELMNQKEHSIPRLLWAGRFINWKHAEAAIWVAKKLKEEGYKFSLEIIGIGELDGFLRKLVTENKLEDTIQFLGSMSPEDVRKHMVSANIYLFTSDYNEGWGAVLNEAMNSGCAIVASHAIGSVPFLIDDGKNGLIYRSRKTNDLYNKVKLLLDDKNLQRKLGISAYNTLENKWNAKVAAERFLQLSHDLQNKKSSEIYLEGPCSKARILKNNWYKG